MAPPLPLNLQPTVGPMYGPAGTYSLTGMPGPSATSPTATGAQGTTMATPKTKEEEIKEKLLDQVDLKKIEPEQEVTLAPQQVQPDELLDDSNNTIGAPTVPAPATIQGTSFQQTPPAATPAETYRASQAAPGVGTAQAVKGQVSKDAEMVAAQGTLSPCSQAVAATDQLATRATTS